MENKGFVTKQGKDMPLGVSLQNNMFNFAVSMPGSSSCNLVLFKKGETEPAEVIPMGTSALGVFTVAVQIPKKAGCTGYEYLYQTGEDYFCDSYAAKINGRAAFFEPEISTVPESALLPFIMNLPIFLSKNYARYIIFRKDIQGYSERTDSVMQKS